MNILADFSIQQTLFSTREYQQRNYIEKELLL